MNIKLRIKTPPGHASNVENQLRLFLLGPLKKPINTYVNEEEDEFYWDIETDIKGFFRINRNAAMFRNLAQGTLDKIEKRTWLKKMANITGTTIDGARSLIDQTQVEVVKNATAQEIVEGNKTFWERIKEKFKKK